MREDINYLTLELEEFFYDTISNLLAEDSIDDSLLKQLNEKIISYVNQRNAIERKLENLID